MGKKKRKLKTNIPTTEDKSRSFPNLFILILSCFFVSGMTGLMYEILWTRMIVKIIGSAPFAISIVLTVFMGGLGLGSYMAGRSIDRIKEPLKLIRLYGILEIAIGAYCLILPLLLIIFKPLYASVYNRFFEYFLGYNLFTFAGCFLLLIVPVTCMGATLPILSRFFITNISNVGTNVGRLYGFNTIGAAAGALLCGFYLIEKLGVTGSLFFIIAINIVIGTVCIHVSRKNTEGKEHPEKAKKNTVSFIEKDQTAATPEQSQIIVACALIVFAVSGFCSMGYEVIWTKLLGLIVGPTTYSFTIVLVTFITGLALGSLFFGWLGDRTKNTISLLLVTQIAAALSALMISQIMGNSQLFFAKLIYHYKDSFALLETLKALLLFVFMFLPTFCLGASFPLVGKIYTRSLSATGRSIGTVYAMNSLGAVLGSFCAGFILIPLTGKEHGLSILIGLQLFSTIIFLIIMILKKKGLSRKQTAIIIPALIGIVLVFVYPQWDRKLLSKGRYHRFNRHEIAETGWLKTLFSGNTLFPNEKAGELIYFGDGIGGFTTVMKNQIDIFGNENLVLYNSGKPDASSRLDMDTQTLLAHFPMLFHPNPDDVLVVGLASGITAGEILHYPIKSLDIVDINKQVVQASELFKTWNNDVLNDPRTNLIIQDGRAHLELTDKKYDVISSEPSNPWMAGLAALFTEELFSLVKDRLNDNGIFVQMFHAYQMDWDTFAMLGRTFSKTFPNSILMGTNPISLGPDFLFVGFKGNRGLNLQTAKDNLIYAGKSSNVTIQDHRLFYNLIVNENLVQLFGDGPINSDNHPWLEFSAPRLMHSVDRSIIQRILSNPGFSKSSINVMNDITTSLDIQLDFIAYALPMIPPEINFESPVDIRQTTPAQMTFYSELIKKYCKENVITDFSFIEDQELQKSCIQIQINSALSRIDISPSKASLYLHIGNLYRNTGDISSAIINYQKSLNINPGSYISHFRLANSYFSQGEYNLALEHYQKSLNIRPDYRKARIGKDKVLQKLRN